MAEMKSWRMESIHGPPRPARSSSHALEADPVHAVQSEMKTVVAADHPVQTIKHPTGPNLRVSTHRGGEDVRGTGGCWCRRSGWSGLRPGCAMRRTIFPSHGKRPTTCRIGRPEPRGRCRQAHRPTGTGNACSSLVATECGCLAGIRDQLRGRTAGTPSRPPASAWPD